jgi:transcriptional regulator of acetoin/glycerol metabolism
MAVSTGDALTAADLGFAADAAAKAEDVPFERTQIEMALLNANGSVSRAAEALGLSRQALYRRMEKLGVVLERRPR